MRAFEIGVLPPPATTGLGLLLAAGRAGELAIYDLEAAPAAEHSGNLARLREALGSRFGVRLELASLSRILPLLQDREPLELILLAGECGDLAQLKQAVGTLRGSARRIFREVVSQTEAEQAVAAGADGVVAKGNESGGRVGSETTFVLLQRFCANSRVPVWAAGGIGPNAAAACRAAGAAGILLRDQLALAEEADLPDALRAQIAAMDGSETVCLGEALGAGFRVHRLRGAATLRALQELERGGASRSAFLSRLHQALANPKDEALLPVGQDAALAARLSARHGTVAAILRAYRRQISDNLRVAANAAPFCENSPLAAALGTRYPVLQGPMTRVSDIAPFAKAVADGGALPFLALALMREAETDKLLAATSSLLAEQPWGVGILAFVPAELRAEQLRSVLKVKPKFALLAGGRPDQAHELEKAGIATFLHAPSARLLEMFLRDGSRRFIFEGRECGGHVGPLSSLVLWESVLEVLLDFQSKQSTREPIDVVFAGGIHDSRSAAMVAALAAPALAAGIRLGVLMGTAYLFTQEAVESGAIVPGFQEEAMRCRETVLLDAEGGHAIRCAPSAYCDEFQEMKRKLARSGATPEEARRQLEDVNVGRLRIASKGLKRAAAGAPLAAVSPEEQKREGMYMIGQVAALHEKLCTIAELHAEACEGSSRRLREFAPAPAEARETEPIAIIGMSCILPGAPDLEQFWSNILNKRDSVREVPAERFPASLFYDSDPNAPDRVVSKWGGFVDAVVFDPMKFGIPPASLPSVEPVQMLMLEVVRRLLRDTGYDRRPFSRERTGVVIGTGGASWDLGLAYQTRCMAEQYLAQSPDVSPAARQEAVGALRRALPHMTEDSFPGILGNVVAGRVANRFDLGGPNFTVDAACASSLAALEASVKELRNRSTDLMVVGGAEGCQNLYGFMLFSKTHALSPRGRCRPFDAQADGIAISDGVAAVLLKRLDDAVRDGDRIYAVIRGVGGGSDGRDKSLTAPSINGQRRALERAYAPLEITPASIGLVEAHGTGTVVGDRTELESMHEVFQAAGAAPQSCALGSVKSQIGHTKNTAGLAGLIKTSLALHHRTLPPTLVEQPSPAARDRSLPFYLNTRSRPWLTRNQEKRRAAVSAFGFGGTNFHAVLEEFPQHAEAQHFLPAELFIFRAASREELVGRLESVEKLFEGRKPPQLAQLARALEREAAKARGESRLAFVAADWEDFRTRLKSAGGLLRRGDAAFPSGGPIAFWEGDGRAPVAFLFSGQGSQYVNMLEELALYFPGVREVFERADELLESALPTPLSRVVFPPPAYSPDEETEQSRALSQTWYAQPALGAADFALYSLLAELGVKPDMLAGHSYGEYVALCVAGSLPFAELMRVSELRGRTVQETQGRDAIGMLAVRARWEDVAKLIGHDTGLSIAGKNAPLQTTIGGSREAIEAFLPRLEAAGISFQRLPMSAGFHIPEAKPAAERLAESFRSVEFQAPSLPVYSNVTAELYPAERDAIREILIAQLTHPVRFQDQVEAMYQAGARIFVEVGPSQVLSGLARQTLGERAALVLASNRQQSTSATADCLSLLAHLYSRGFPLRLEKLHSGGLAVPTLAELAREEKPPATAWLVDGGRAKPLHAVTKPTAPPKTKEVPVAAAPPPVSPPTSTPPRAAVPTLSLPELPPLADAGAAQLVAAFQETMRRFLEYQAQSQARRQELMTRFLDTQRALLEACATGSGGPQLASLLASAQPATPPASAAREIQFSAPPPSRATQPGRPAPPAGAAVPIDLRATVLELVSERTGYPPEMLNLDYQMEADLGIDSIKRTEIFGALRERLGLVGDAYEKEEYFLAIARLRTLREVLAWLQEQAPLVAGTAADAELSTRPARPSPVAEAAAPPRANGEEVAQRMRRYLVTPVLEHLSEGRREPREHEVVLITEDRGGRARELQAALHGLGYSAALVRHNGAAGKVSPGVFEADLLSRDSVKQLREVVEHDLGKVTAICHLAALDSTSGADCFEVKSLFRLASAFGSSLRDCEGTLLTVSALGGAFATGKEEAPFRPGANALTGFLKSLAHEWPNVFIKAVDVDPKQSEEHLLSQLLAEIGSSDRTVEVGYSARGRLVLHAREAALDASGPALVLDRESVVLITGGARGITASVAAALAERFQPRLVVLGRSPLPVPEEAETASINSSGELKRVLAERRMRRGELVTPSAIEAQLRALLQGREVRANLERIAALGVSCEYHSLDVRNRSGLESLVDSIYRRYGRLDGVLHGAGIVEDRLLLEKPAESFDRVFDTKALSALHLAGCLRPESLRFFVLFSSLAARLGYAGGTDYAAANEVLNKLAWKLDREWPGRVVSIGWGPWSEVGIAARYPQELIAQRGLEYFPIAVGCKWFLDELLYGRKGESEVLIYAAKGGGPVPGTEAPLADQAHAAD